MKKLSSTATTTATRQHHHHHHHSHSFSYSPNATTKKERIFPLHRSITEDDKYHKSNTSPITRFVCKLLGLAGPSSSSSCTKSAPSRPKDWHKSRSTTSITKSSVTSSYQHTTLHACASTETAAAAAAVIVPRKPTAITIVTPKPCIASVLEWDTVEDDTISVSSSESSASSSNGTINSSISSLTNTKATTTTTTATATATTTTSAAVDALVIASLLPTLKTRSTDEFDDIPPVRLMGRQHDTNSAVLTEMIAEMVRPYIPRRFRIAQNWNLAYSLDQHGVSLGTLYSRMEHHDGPCIMIIKDAEEQIFGAYLSHPFSSQSHYYGTGECFLWKFNPQQQPQPKIKVFPWTGKNEYMMLSDSELIAIGGGDGKFGLWLDSEFDKGYSTTCPTFDNECLALQPEFQCMEMEIWSVCV